MKQALAVDIGGTKTAIARILENGVIEAQEEIATKPQDGGERLLARIAQRLTEMGRQHNIVGVGVGSAGQIGRQGEVLSATDTFAHWRGIHISRRLTALTGWPVKVVNDVQAMGLGEQAYGAGKDVKNFICLALGTGVGGAIVADGQLLRGHLGAAGEMGHMILVPQGRLCPCGNRGCLEAYLSGTALETLYYEKTGMKQTARQIFATTQHPQSPAAQLVEQYQQHLSIALTSLIHLFNPQKVILGGGVARSLTTYLSSLQQTVRSQLHLVNRGVVIEQSALGGQAMLLGAARLVWEQAA